MYSNLDIIILCGGLGTRFRGVDDKIPKSLGNVSGKPIIRWLIDDIKANGKVTTEEERQARPIPKFEGKVDGNAL